MTHLGRKVRDKRLLGLIARYLRAGIIDNQLYLENREGIPQGGPLSPLLASISHFLEHRLKLAVNTTKSRVVRTHDSKFLGFTFKGTKGAWRSSKAPGIQQALSNDYLKAEGLVSLRDGWIKLHHSR